AWLPGSGRSVLGRHRGHGESAGGDRSGGLGRSARAARSAACAVDARSCSTVGGMTGMTSGLEGEIRDGRHLQQVRVYYEDTDFSGIVYHASYLRFMERGRTNYLRLIGADHRALFEQTEKEAPGFAFVVRHMSIDFRKPAFMDDVLDIVTT